MIKKTIFKIFFISIVGLMVSCGSNVDSIKNKTSFEKNNEITENNSIKNNHQKLYIFKNLKEKTEDSNIDFLKNAPVNQLQLIPIDVKFSEFEKNILDSGYIKESSDSSLAFKRYEIEKVFDKVNNIYFFYEGSQLPDLSSNIYSIDKSLEKQDRIILNLSFDIDTETSKYRKINLDLSVPLILFNSLSGIDRIQVANTYKELLNSHIVDIENNVNTYGDLLVTNRVEESGYWLELNTLLTHNNTKLYIYKSKGVPNKTNRY